MTPNTDWKCPDATRVLTADAPRDQWLAARKSGIGASEIASVLRAEGAYGTPWTVWLDKTDPGTDDTDNELLRMGRDIEEVVVARFTEQTGIATRRYGLARSKQQPHLMASVDRLTADGGLLEAKTHTGHSKAREDWKAGRVPVKFWWQVQQQLLVTGRRHAWLAAYVVGVGFYVERVERDKGAMRRIADEGAAFWLHVENETAPPLDPIRDPEDEIKARWPEVVEPGRAAEAAIPEAFIAMHARRAELKAAEAGIKKELREIDAQVKAAISDREFLTANGVPLFRWRQINTTRFNQSALTIDHPELFVKYQRAVTTRRLDPIKGALDKETESAA